MRLSIKHYFAFIVIAFQLIALNSGCSQQAPESSPDLIALRGKLIKQYGHEDISVVIQNSNILSVSLVNSPFNELGEFDRQKQAQAIAVFVSNNFGPINKVESVLVSFVTSETYVFIFQYDEGRTYQFDKNYLLHAGVLVKPAEDFVRARASYLKAQDKTVVGINNLQLYGDLNKGLILVPSFTVQGKKIVRPEWVDLEFASYDDRKTFASNRSIAIVVDNKSVDSGNARFISTGKTAEGYVSEFLSHSITYEQFLQIVNGREVQLKLGPKVIRLTPEHLRLLREMKACVDASNCQ